MYLINMPCALRDGHVVHGKYTSCLNLGNTVLALHRRYLGYSRDLRTIVFVTTYSFVTGHA